MSKTRKAIISLPKATIFSILGAVVTYLVSRGYIGTAESDLFSAILVALGATANAITRSKDVS